MQKSLSFCCVDLIFSFEAGLERIRNRMQFTQLTLEFWSILHMSIQSNCLLVNSRLELSVWQHIWKLRISQLSIWMHLSGQLGKPVGCAACMSFFMSWVRRWNLPYVLKLDLAKAKCYYNPFCVFLTMHLSFTGLPKKILLYQHSY